MANRGKFLVFEGPNGIGKSTLVHQISDVLAKMQLLSVTAKFPSAGQLGELCRAYANRAEHSHTLACLIAADFYRSMIDEIEPALNQGKIVLCDRFSLSSYVYQQVHGVEERFLKEILWRLPVPDLCFVLTASEEFIAARRKVIDDLFSSPEKISTELSLYLKHSQIYSEMGVTTKFLDVELGSHMLLQNTISTIQELLR